MASACKRPSRLATAPPIWPTNWWSKPADRWTWRTLATWPGVNLTRLNVEIRAVEVRLGEVLAEDRLAQALLTIPGVGLVTAAAMRGEIGRFDRFRTDKQLARFCGLTPRNASSGRRQADAGLIRAGNTELRRVLTQAAHRLIRYEPRWLALACQLKARGKHTPLVVAAVANRWIRSLQHQFQEYGLAV